jgi:LemA protein
MGIAAIIGLAFLGLVVVVALWAVLAYNRLVALREAVRTGWAQIDVLLKRRYDLIPNLVESVKGYAAHEKETLDRVITARNAAASVKPGNTAAAIAADNQLTGSLRQLFAVAEAYPDLKANQNFLQLQGELSSSENHVASVRGSYNNTVQQYNTAIQSFPTNLLAGPFGFTTQPFFEVQDAGQREVPKVKF